MKKFLSLSVLIGCFLMLATTKVSAQDAIRNNTPCEFLVKVAYGDLAGCDVAGFMTVTVPPFTQISLGTGMEILYAKGVPDGTPIPDCAFYIAQGFCAPYPQTDFVTNPQCCDGYSATIFTGFGIYLTN